MISNFFKKQKDKKDKKNIIANMIRALNIKDNQKILYLSALEIIEEENLENLFNEITYFVEHIEEKELQNIQKKNFMEIAGMRKKEVKEKQKDVNAFSFLLSKL